MLCFPKLKKSPGYGFSGFLPLTLPTYRIVVPSSLRGKFSWLFAACLPHGVHNVMSTAGNAGPKTAETVRYTRRRRKSSFNRSTPIFKDAQPPAASPPPEDTYWARVEAEV